MSVGNRDCEFTAGAGIFVNKHQPIEQTDFRKGYDENRLALTQGTSNGVVLDRRRRILSGGRYGQDTAIGSDTFDLRYRINRIWTNTSVFFCCKRTHIENTTKQHQSQKPGPRSNRTVIGQGAVH